MAERFRRVRPSALVPRDLAARVNELQAAVEALLAPRGGGGLNVTTRPGGLLFSDPDDVPEGVPGPVWLRIDGAGVSSSRYEAWTEVAGQGDGTFLPPADPLAGSSTFPAYLVAGAAPAVGDVVLAWWSEGRESLLFEGPPPASGAGGGVYGERNGGAPLGPETTVNFIEGANIALTVADDAPNARLNVTVATAATLAVAATGGLGSEYRDAWAADQNDYALPAGAAYLNVDPTANLKLTGIANGAANRLLAVVNRSPSHTLTLKHEDAGSAAGNRLLLPAGSQWILGPGDGIWLYYSGTDSRWYGIETEAAAGVTPPLTTKGDLWGFDTVNNRVPVGTNGQVLTADSTQALGLKWAAASGGVTPSGARAYNSADLTGRANDSAIPLDSERWDTDSYHSTSTNTSRLTVPATGRYHVGGCAGLKSPSHTGTSIYASLYVRRNGATIVAVQTGYLDTLQLDNLILNVGTDVDATAGDYFELVGNCSGGTQYNVVSGAEYEPEFWIHRIA